MIFSNNKYVSSNYPTRDQRNFFGIVSAIIKINSSASLMFPALIVTPAWPDNGAHKNTSMTDSVIANNTVDMTTDLEANPLSIRNCCTRTEFVTQAGVAASSREVL
jgi:hypothetical protein